MNIATVFSQIGLILGFLGSVLLSLSLKVGVMMKNGRMRFDGLDGTAPSEENKRRVRNSHWRNKYFTPAGWFLLAAAFFLQFIAGFFRM